MSSEQDIKTATECFGYCQIVGGHTNPKAVIAVLAHAITQAREEEREECANIANPYAEFCISCECVQHSECCHHAEEIAALIRARNNPEGVPVLPETG